MKKMGIIKKRLLVSSIIVLGLLLVYYQYFLLPLLTETGEIKKELVENEEKLRRMRDADEGANPLVSSVKSLEAKLDDIETVLPPAPEASGIIVDIEEFSAAADVKLLSMDFNTEAASEPSEMDAQGTKGCLEIPMGVYVSGNFKCILDFLEEIENADRMYRVDGFELSTSGVGKSNTFNLSVALRAFYY